MAPPWSGPDRALMPAAMETNRLASLDPTMRTVAVEQFCSWSACRTSSMLSASLTDRGTSYGSAGTANIMCRKFSV